MSNCNCPSNLQSMHQLCAFCEADYLRYISEIDLQAKLAAITANDQDANSRPATLGELEALTDWTFDQTTLNAIAISQASERLQKHEKAIEAMQRLFRIILQEPAE